MTNTTFTAHVWFRHGVNKGYTKIMEGYRAEIIDGLSDGCFVYTGVCETAKDAVNELIDNLKSRGFSGKLKVIYN